MWGVLTTQLHIIKRSFPQRRTCLKPHALLSMDLCTQRQCQLSTGGLLSITIVHRWLSSIFRLMKMLTILVGGWKMTARGGRGEQRWKGRGRQTERFYWLVSSSSVDCDKFNHGNPLKADAAPIFSPSLSLSFVLQPCSLQQICVVWYHMSATC